MIRGCSRAKHRSLGGQNQTDTAFQGGIEGGIGDVSEGKTGPAGEDPNQASQIVQAIKELTVAMLVIAAEIRRQGPCQPPGTRMFSVNDQKYSVYELKDFSARQFSGFEISVDREGVPNGG